MKNKKLLVGLLSASGIAMTLPAIASCSCSKQYNEPEVSPKTPKSREVGAKATRTYFLITQGNINQPEETKVKMINLKVNGADAKPVAGLIRYANDSAGNILVVFNMSIAIKQYQADNITFDLKLTNKKANTEYTVTDFSVIISDKSSAVTYNVDECPGIVWKQNPDTIGYDEDLDIQFSLESGYEWNTITSDDIDVTIDGKSIKADLIELENNRSDPDDHYFYFDTDGEECFIYILKEYISPNSDIQITLKSHGVTYSVNHDAAGATQHIKYTGADQVTHPDDYKPTIEPETKYYTFDPANQSWDVVMNEGTAAEVSLKDSGDAQFEADKKTLKVDGKAILGNLTISAEAVPSTWSVGMTASTHMTAKTLASATYGQTDYSQDITVEPYYTYKLTSATVDDVEGTAGTDISQYVHITHTTGTTTLNVKIDKEAIKGKINLVFTDDGTKFDVTSSTTDTEIQFEEGKIGTETAQYGVDYTIGVSCKDSWYVVDSTKFVVKCGGSAMTSGYSFANDTLTIDGDSIKGAIDIKAESKKKEFTVTNNLGTGITLTSKPTVAKYNEACEWVYSVDSTHTLDIANVKATIAGSPATELTIANGGLVHTPANNKIAIASDKLTSIKGNITFDIPSTTITVGGTITGLTFSSVESKYIGDEAVLSFTVGDDYLLNKKDFTDGNAKIYDGSSTSGTLIPEGNISVDADAGTVTIAADVITGNQLYLDGKLTQYKASVTEKSGQTGVFKSITKPDYATSSADFVVSYELNTGYTTPSATVEVAGTELATTDYTITATTLTIPKAKITGKVEITNLTALKTLKWADTFESTVAIGTTSTNAYKATAIAGGASATVSIKNDGGTGAKLESGKLNATNATAGIVTLQAVLDGAVTLEGTVTIKNDLILSKGLHQLDNESSGSITITATYNGTDVSSSCTWSTPAGSPVSVTGGVVTVSATGKASGGTGVVTCEYNVSANEKLTKTYNIEVASWNKIQISQSSSKVIVNSRDNITGTVIIPAYWYGEGGTGTIYETPLEVNYINAIDYQTSTITSIIISNTITEINGFACQNCTSLSNVTFKSGSKLTTIPENCFNGCTALTTITLPDSITTIKRKAFYKSGLTTFTVNNNVTSIGISTFENCASLTSITFVNTSNWIASSTGSIDVSSPSTNATNLTTGVWKSTTLTRSA